MKNKANQAGFTLIELIIVIVILGILAVTASPKFLDIQGDARKSTLQGMAGSLKGAVNIVYSKALVAGEAIAKDQTLTSNTAITVDFGYPQADATTIKAMLDLASTDWEVGVTSAAATNTTLRIYPVGQYDGLATGEDTLITTNTDLGCYVQYVMTETATSVPAITVVDTDC